MTIRTAPDAVNVIKTWATYPARMCLNAMSRLYQHGDASHMSMDAPAFAVANATQHWNKTDAAHKHPGDKDAPAGGLYQCVTGDGHIFISIGGGRARSTDFPAKGQIGEGTVQEILNHFSGNQFVGWVDAINGNPIQGLDHSTTLAAQQAAPAGGQDLDSIARAVIRGDWGNGDDRKQRLTAAGYDYNAVQARVNQLLAQPTGNGPQVYTVQRGDNLSSIAARFHVPGGWQALYNANRSRIGNNPNVIRAGLVLNIPA